MEKPDLEELRNLPIPELAERVVTLSTADLMALRGLEAADREPRKGALAAIDEAIQKSDQSPPAPPAKGDTKAGKPAKVDKPATAPAWQAADYGGPLTCDQMQWRLHNIKPVTQVRTK